MLEEGFNPYESTADSDASQYGRRLAAVRSAPSVEPAGRHAVASIQAPTSAAGIRDFDFAAAMFADDNAWRELARSIARDAA